MVRRTESHRSLGSASRATLAGYWDDKGILQYLTNGFVQDALRLGKEKALQVGFIHNDEITGSCGASGPVNDVPS